MAYLQDTVRKPNPNFNIRFMKKLSFYHLTLPAAIMFAASSSLTVSAQTVTALTQTSGNTLPGDGGVSDPNYTFFGAFQPGGGNGSKELTDFTQQTNGFNGTGLPTIFAPAGSVDSNGNPITTTTAQSVITGEQFFAIVPVDLVDFTVLSTAGSNYNLAAFFGIVGAGVANDPNSEYFDGSFTITLNDASGTQLSTSTLSVADNNTSNTNGLFANFLLTGLAAGDVIHVIGTPAQSPTNIQLPYVGGVGFSAATAPEPSTYAMMILGSGALMFLARRKLANS